MALTDPHSFADDEQPRIRHMEIDLYVDFDARMLRGHARLHLEAPPRGALDLDTRDLIITAIRGEAPKDSASFELGPIDPILGQRLRIHTTSPIVDLEYRTSPTATALQWLDPTQTRGGQHPYVFTQCQAIHARSILPCQDTPRTRATFTLSLNTPRSLLAVAAAAPKGRRDVSGLRTVFNFEMPQPIPSYLFAFAVGNIASRDVGARSRVYAEPELLDAAVFEFRDLDPMLSTAEALFGPYRWDRFDVLVMPPSFPYGGMENPRLTFLTPTLIAGDRSLVNVVAHELAHSWTGNLVTNASMNDFWLNEGFTVYAERRIIEALEGVEGAALHAVLGREGLERDIQRLNQKDPKLTRLRNDLRGVDPDEVYSQVPYEKGYLFLVRLEREVGRERFDAFLRRYIERFSFTSITTQTFLTFLNEELPEAGDRAHVDIDRWIDDIGIPEDAPAFASERLTKIEGLIEGWKAGERPSSDAMRVLSSTEWQVLLARLPKVLSVEDCAWLDQTFKLSRVENAEIRIGWLTIAAASQYAPAYSAIRETLLSVGRMKYLRPLYTALIESGERGTELARQAFDAAKDAYHPVAKSVVHGLLSNVIANPSTHEDGLQIPGA